MSLIVDIKKDFGDFLLDAKLETDGGVTGLLGASGSGKSVTMMCVAGIIKPDCGRIILGGRTLFDSKRNINLTPQQRRVGYLFQNYALFPNMTVRQNILCSLRSEKDKAKKEKTLGDIIEMTELGGFEERYPHQLSGGQRQRAALARIIVGSPELLILDEPLSAIDGHLRESLQAETRKLLGRLGKETILVSHSRDEIYYMCKNIALIDNGAIICMEDTKQLFRSPGSIRAAILTGCKNISSAEKTGEYRVRAIDWGIELTTAGPVSDSLCAVGIRAHYFDAGETRNSHKIHITDEIEKPFEFDIRFRFENQEQGAKDVCLLMPKEKKATVSLGAVGADPGNIMLLHK